MSPSHQYRERDYDFANTFISLRTTIGLTQQGLAKLLGVSSRAVENWEQGLTSPRAEHVKAFLALCMQSSAFAAGREEEQIRALWRTAGLKVLLDEHWLSELLKASSSLPSGGGEQEKEVASQPLSIWMVPYIRNSHFTGRDELLSHLQQRFAPREAEQSMPIQHAALTQSQAIKGLGGIGKTQTAIEYAYRAREQGRYTHTIWVSATDEETVLSSFAALKDVVPALKHSEENDQHAVAKAALRWLEQCQDPWLLIYDNADDLSLLPAYLPKAGRGNILLTTRASAVGALAASLDVEVLPLSEGVQLLLHRAGYEREVSEQEREEAGKIVLALAQFPLAIDQAGAYIEETRCSLSDYLDIYQQHQYELLAQRGKQSTGYPDSVATTWSLAFEWIERTNPAAAELLRLCAFVAPDQLPEELLTEGASHWPAVLQEAVRDRFRFNQVLSTLLGFSLIKRVGRERMLSLHRLVQVVQRERMAPQEQHQWAERFVRAVNAIFPRYSQGDVTSWPLCLRYLEQVQSCNVLIQQHHLLLHEAADVLDRTGTYLRERALYSFAEPLYQQALHIWEQQEKPDVLRKAQSLNNLAVLYYWQDKLAQAEQLYRQALSIREQQLGTEHLDVADTLHGLAGLYSIQMKYSLAEPLYQQAIRIREQQLGPDHFDVAESLNGLAVLYEKQGKYAEAKLLTQRALGIREQQLGPDHLSIAESLNDLAMLYSRTQEKQDEVEALFLRAMYIWEQHLGSGHMMVTYPLLNLATQYRMQGNYAKAESLYVRVLHIREQHLGTMHRNLVPPLTGLAFTYLEQARYEEAEQLFLRALRMGEQQVGPQHSFVASVLEGLGRLYSLQDKFLEAEQLLLRALRIREQNEHTDGSNSLRALANLYTRQGNYVQAEPLYRQALHIREHHLGPRHLQTAQILADFADFQQAQGSIEDAVLLYKRVVSIREQILGMDSPMTLACRERLQALLIALDRKEGAVMLGAKRQEIGIEQ